MILWYKSKSCDLVREDEVGLGRRDGSNSGQMGCRTKGSYTHKLYYPSERHDDVLPLVLGFHWHTETSNTPSSTNYNLGASLASRGFFHSSFCHFETNTKLCVNPSLPNLSTHSRAVSLHRSQSLSQSSPLVPFHQTEKITCRSPRTRVSLQQGICSLCEVWYLLLHHALCRPHF